jgi:phage FluMu gp28-like protein
MATTKKEALEKLRAKVEAARATAGVALRDVPLDDLAKRVESHPLGVNANGWVNPYAKDDPRSLLLEYQFAWREDPARFKAGLMSRQSGKDFSSESEAAEDCFANPKTEWMIAAPSERQALDSLEQGKVWAEAFGLLVDDYNEAREGVSSETLLKSAEIKFSNGSRMRAVPGKPSTTRGRSANILLTEFDFFEQPAETWRAILPSITNPLRGGQKKVRLITTPNGIGSAMNKIWTKADTDKMRWSRHVVTIYHAVLMGLPVNIAELKEAFDDADGFAQEFLCQFLDVSTVLLPYELIAANEDATATADITPEYWRTQSSFPVDLGIDFGRKRDLTICWAAEKIGELQMTKEVLPLEKKSTPDQVDILRPRIQKARRVCLDYTGPGIGLGDLLVKEFGEYNPKEHKFGKIELCTLTNSFKLEIFPKLRIAFEKRNFRVPISRDIREDLHSVNRIVTATGAISYRAPHTADGHADRCSAAALLVRAGGQENVPLLWSALV